MGISTSPDEYQACMEKVFGDLDFVVVYLDDILVPFTWLTSDTSAFQATQRAFAEAVLLSFPDFEAFDVYADASGTQLGGIIMQGVKNLACYSRSLTKHQVNYTTMELELLSIVEILREYRTMLLGFLVVVHTDHKNLIYPTENSLRVKRWNSLLSKYRLTMEDIKGKKNIGAGAFSRMRFGTCDGPPLHEGIYALNTQYECVMHGPVIREHQEKGTMIQQIKTAYLAGNNNPDY
ncbi:unnamed protein product [Phytophthora fragariaefolia]|uniref:Unnamed protein product n=1 Tax=Phytophthora fragariaefolia TaxID=1490495 RepID=A0A9W6TY41_9STRA|nr:unnamed protein product [Phytophthora fragariaefolia]